MARETPAEQLGSLQRAAAASRNPVVQLHAGKVTEDRKLLELRMDFAQSLLIARQITATAGINEEPGLESFRIAGVIAGVHGHRVTRVGELASRPAFADLGAG